MKPACIIVWVVLLVLGQPAASISGEAEKQKTEGSKGTTVEDLGRGLKGAAQRVEKEIPKIGSAIGGTFRKITEKSSGNKSAQEPPKEKK